jgi:hypothetical protein
LLLLLLEGAGGGRCRWDGGAGLPEDQRGGRPLSPPRPLGDADWRPYGVLLLLLKLPLLKLRLGILILSPVLRRRDLSANGFQGSIYTFQQTGFFLDKFLF